MNHCGIIFRQNKFHVAVSTYIYFAYNRRKEYFNILASYYQKLCNFGMIIFRNSAKHCRGISALMDFYSAAPVAVIVLYIFYRQTPSAIYAFTHIRHTIGISGNLYKLFLTLRLIPHFG